MITLTAIKKFLIWANLGLYRKNNPINRVELRNDSPHYKINDLNELEINEEVLNFNKAQGDTGATLLEQIKKQSEQVRRNDAEQIKREG